jgi:hypothetical protein
MVYTLVFFSSKCSLFHNSNVFCSCVIQIYIQSVLKFKKNNSGAKRLTIFPIPVAVHESIHVFHKLKYAEWYGKKKYVPLYAVVLQW